MKHDTLFPVSLSIATWQTLDYKDKCREIGIEYKLARNSQIKVESFT